MKNYSIDISTNGKVDAAKLFALDSYLRERFGGHELFKSGRIYENWNKDAPREQWFAGCWGGWMNHIAITETSSLVLCSKGYADNLKFSDLEKFGNFVGRKFFGVVPEFQFNNGEVARFIDGEWHIGCKKYKKEAILKAYEHILESSPIPINSFEVEGIKFERVECIRFVKLVKETE